MTNDPKIGDVYKYLNVREGDYSVIQLVGYRDIPTIDHETYFDVRNFLKSSRLYINGILHTEEQYIIKGVFYDDLIEGWEKITDPKEKAYWLLRFENSDE